MFVTFRIYYDFVELYLINPAWLCKRLLYVIHTLLVIDCCLSYVILKIILTYFWDFKILRRIILLHLCPAHVVFFIKIQISWELDYFILRLLTIKCWFIIKVLVNVRWLVLQHLTLFNFSCIFNEIDHTVLLQKLHPFQTLHFSILSTYLRGYTILRYDKEDITFLIFEPSYDFLFTFKFCRFNVCDNLYF